MKKIKRTFAAVLAVVLTVCLLPGAGISAFVYGEQEGSMDREQSIGQEETGASSASEDPEGAPDRSQDGPSMEDAVSEDGPAVPETEPPQGEEPLQDEFFSPEENTADATPLQTAIDLFKASVKSGAEENSGLFYTDIASGNARITLELEYQLSGGSEYGAGSVVLRIPAHLTPDDVCSLSRLDDGKPFSGYDVSYDEKTKEYVLRNKEVAAPDFRDQFDVSYQFNDETESSAASFTAQLDIRAKDGQSAQKTTEKTDFLLISSEDPGVFAGPSAALFAKDGTEDLPESGRENEEKINISVQTSAAVPLEEQEAFLNTVSSRYGDLQYSLYRNGASVNRASLGISNGWFYTWTDLDRYDASGSEYVYTVRRTYPSSIYAPYEAFPANTDLPLEDGVFTDTWTQPERITVTAKITWNDYENRLGLRPEEIGRVTLSYGDPNDIRDAFVTANGDGAYTAVWENIPASYNGQTVSCVITENDLPGNYTASSSGSWKNYQVTNSLRCKTYTANLSFDPSLLKRFEETGGFTLPDTMTAVLLLNGEAASTDDGTHTFSMDSANGWINGQSYTWAFPTHTEDGQEIALPEDGYSVSWKTGLDDDRRFHVEVTETARQSRCLITYPTISITYQSKLTWDDEANAAGLRPSDVTATLLANGSPAPGVPEVSLKNSQRYLSSSTWRDLPKLDENGDPIQYSIRVNNLPAFYEASFSESPVFDETGAGYGAGKNITEDITLKLKKQNVTADIQWTDGSETELKNRPSSVNLTLEYTADGQHWQPFWGQSVYAVSADSDGNWHKEWTLPDVDVEGNPITFRVRENDLSLYNEDVPQNPFPVTGEDGIRSTEIIINNYYEDAWDYAIDLSWDTKKPEDKYDQKVVTTSVSGQTAKYQLTISANEDYEAGQLSVRIPRALFNDANGSPVIPAASQISVPLAPAVNAQYSFHYAIDDNGTPDDPGDDFFVFTNHEKILSGFKQTLTVGYTIAPGKVTDLSRGVLQAAGSGQSVNQTVPTVRDSNQISYTLDTGVRLSNFNKKAAGGYNDTGLVYAWDPSLNIPEEEFDPSRYNYVTYQLYGYVYRNQPFRVALKDLPDNGGTVLAVKFSGGWGTGSGTDYQVTLNSETGCWESGVIRTHTDNSLREPYEIIYYNVTVAYPRMEDPENAGHNLPVTYRNDAVMNIYAADEHAGDKEPDDKNDISTGSSGAQVPWKDYEFHFDGQVCETGKTLYSFSKGSLTQLQYGEAVRTSASISGVFNGYLLEHGYRFSMEDDAVFAQAKADGQTTDYVRLDEADFSIVSGISVRLSCSDIDRTDGTTIVSMDQIPAEPFTLYGRRGNNGAWEKIGDIRMTQPEEKTYTFDKTAIEGQGYTGLRLVSPEGLSGQFQAAIQATIEIKGDSPSAKAFFETGSVEQIDVLNYMNAKLYTADEYGEYTWANALDAPAHALDAETGLAEEDKAREGAYLNRSYSRAPLLPAARSSSCIKTTGEVLNDTVNSKADVQFRLFERESINNTVLPETVYENMAQADGVFYDLLPAGYFLNKEKGVTVQGAYYAAYNAYSGYSFTTKNNAVLESMETTDNWRGTGRQLVIFHVKSIEAPGKNYQTAWSEVGTGFLVTYYASVSWSDLSFYPSGYNITSFQRGDDRDIVNGYTEQGYPGNSQDTKIWPNDSSGTPALYDFDNDGEISGSNTLYAYSQVSPQVYTTVQSGISKVVKGAGSYYSSNDVTDLNSDYSYKISLTTSDNGTTSDVVLIDILENAANVDGATGETGWQGTFKGVGYAMPLRQGIDVKVYYSTASGLSYNDENNMKLDSGLWSPDPPADLSEVTAVAFDLSTASDGAPFLFDRQMSTEVEIYMQSPKGLQPEAEYAYNRPAYWSKFQINGGNIPQTVLNNGPRTTVALRNLQDFSFMKQIQDDANGQTEMIPLGGAPFQLYQCTSAEEGHAHTGRPGEAGSCWGSVPLRRVTSNSTGLVRFEDLDTGIYAIREIPLNVVESDYTYNCYWIIEVNAQKGSVSAPVAVSLKTGLTAPEMTRDKESDPYTLVNERKKISISITKKWVDGNDLSLRPAKMIFDLYRNGLLYRTEETATSGYPSNLVRFSDLYRYDMYGNEYTYVVKEHPVPGYTADIRQFTASNAVEHSIGTFTNTKLGVLDIKKLVSEGGDKTKEFTFHVMLTDNEGAPVAAGGGIPSSFTVYRYREGSAEYTEDAAALGKDGVLAITLRHGETARIIGLPLNISYIVSEDSSKEYSCEVTAGSASGTTSSSSTGSVTFTNTLQTTAVSGNKTWDDNENQDGMRLEEITVRLYADGTETAHKKVSEDTNWSWTFDGLPEYKGNRKIHYTITEDPVPNYQPLVTGYNIINRHTPGKISLPIVKAWDDADDQDGIRPKEITVRLLADEEDTGKTLRLTAAEGWAGSFDGLDEYKDGKKIVYTIEEIEIPGYTVEINGDMSTGFRIANSHTPEKILPPDPGPKKPGGIRTGDDNDTALWLILSGLSMFTIFALLIMRRRRGAGKRQ